MTLEEQVELAKKSTGLEWIIVTYANGGGIGYVVLKSDPDVLWKPDLNGKDWQVAQACRVIEAAFNLPGNVSLYKINTAKGVYFQVIRGSVPGLLHEDPLTACSKAILEGGGK